MILLSILLLVIIGWVVLPLVKAADRPQMRPESVMRQQAGMQPGQMDPEQKTENDAP